MHDPSEQLHLGGPSRRGRLPCECRTVQSGSLVDALPRLLGAAGG